MSSTIIITITLFLVFATVFIAFIYNLFDFILCKIKRNDKNLAKAQILYVSKEIEDFALSFPQVVILEGYKTLYTIEMVKNKAIEWICSNDIFDDDISIKNKQDEVWLVIHSIPHNETFHSDEFRNKCNNKVQEILRHLVLMGKH
ncbi:MAG: hypothetical protein KBT03_03220 [Bacteroidales bacterium]|nr:hypothetical protein [Candidatus Scybalousia scybalohippi]